MGHRGLIPKTGGLNPEGNGRVQPWPHGRSRMDLEP